MRKASSLWRLYPQLKIACVNTKSNVSSQQELSQLFTCVFLFHSLEPPPPSLPEEKKKKKEKKQQHIFEEKKKKQKKKKTEDENHKNGH